MSNDAILRSSSIGECSAGLLTQDLSARANLYIFPCLLMVVLSIQGFAQLPMIPRPEYYNVTVPKRAETDKLLASPIPFGTNLSGSRFQQVYPASHFADIPSGGAFITDIYLRPGCHGDGGTFIPDLKLRMCTTPRTAGSLDPFFENNVSQDALEVYSSPLTTIRGNLDIRECENLLQSRLDWKHTLGLVTPFFYDPKKGSLLLDWTIPAHTLEHKSFRVWTEVTGDLSDGTSSIAAAGTNATQAEFVSNAGLVTRFIMAPFPRLSVTPSEAGLILSWPTKPSPTRLQVRDSLLPAVQWVDFVDPAIVRGDLTSYIELSNQALSERRYFRLYWDTPQIGLPNTTVEVPAKPTPKPLTP